MKIDPYLMFDGTCAEAFRYYERCFKGRIEMMLTYAEAPPDDEMAGMDKNRIMHASLEVSGQKIMASDCPPGRFEPMRGLWVSLNVESIGEAERIFKELSDKGAVVMPIAETFWAARFGMTVDRFGTPWMINCDKPS